MVIINASSAILMELLHGEDFILRLIRRISDRTHGAIHIKHGSAYPAMMTLKKQKLIRMARTEDGGGRLRRIYQLTEAGKLRAEEHREAIIRLLQIDLPGTEQQPH